jgi:LmbE family N-acetylglucosaminyl deacetylase
VACIAALSLCAGRASALAPCAGADLYVAAHQDDTILFESPSLLEDVHSNRCVRTVFTTAGDAGKAAKYWEGRETGAEAAYAQMAGVASLWTGSQVTLAGHSVHMETLVGRPGISIIYLRLPDGGVEGEGFPLYGNQSLKKLWNSGNSGSPSIAEIEADDKSAKYKYAQLVATLTAAIQSFGAHQIVTQNYESPLEKGPNHSDHGATGRFVKAAAEALPGSFGGWRLTDYEDYEVLVRPANVSGPLLEAKEAAFAAYVLFDEACGVEEDCGAPPYPEWLARQYVKANKTKGVVADAGLEQSAGPSSPVALSGAASSSEGGGPLGYSWTQVGGPPVALNGANTVSPTLTTPSHPTLLTFALTVSSGVIISTSDFVRVRVPSATPNPTAIVGPDQSVGARAHVTLDGSASWDPESLPLVYGWTQTGGPPVSLGDPTASRPTFTAPDGPAMMLTFSLVVSNGAQSSSPASVRVSVAQGTVKPPPPPPPPRPRAKLSRKRVKLTPGRRARRVIVVTGGSAKSCRGRLPAGVLCRITQAGNVVIEARPSLKRSGTFHLIVNLRSGSESIKRPLIVVIKRAKTQDSRHKIK